METTALVQQNQLNENVNSEDKPVVVVVVNGGSDVIGDNCNENVVNSNGDCETNKMLNKPENIEMSTSTADIRCCNGFFLRNAAKKGFNKKQIVKETQTNGNTGNGKCYFGALKEKLSNGKHTQLVNEEKCDTLDLKKAEKAQKQKKQRVPPVFDDRDPFKINSNVKVY